MAIMHKSRNVVVGKNVVGYHFGIRSRVPWPVQESVVTFGCMMTAFLEETDFVETPTTPRLR